MFQPTDEANSFAQRRAAAGAGVRTMGFLERKSDREAREKYEKEVLGKIIGSLGKLLPPKSARFLPVGVFLANGGLDKLLNGKLSDLLKTAGLDGIVAQFLPPWAGDALAAAKELMKLDLSNLSLASLTGGLDNLLGRFLPPELQALWKAIQDVGGFKEILAQIFSLTATPTTKPSSGSGPWAARLGDLVVCPGGAGMIVQPCAPTVLVGGFPAARVTDIALCNGLPVDVLDHGAPTVEIGGQWAARKGDFTAHKGVIATGFPTVHIGKASAKATIALSSPSPSAPATPRSRGANGPFATQDDAARAALESANPQSIKDNREYAGLIYRGTDGQYYFTGPVSGTDQTANPYSAPAPPGTQVVGDYHTHGDYSTADPTTGAAVRTSDPSRDDFNSDNFSTSDKNGIANDAKGIPGYKGYLGTPSGTFRKYDPVTGSDTTL